MALEAQPKPPQQHPFVREFSCCVFCGQSKPRNALACWSCFNELLKDGNDPEAEAMLDAAEAEHREANGQFGAGR